MAQIPIQNIYYLLCYAWDKLEEQEVLGIEAVEGNHVIDLLGNVLAHGTAHLMQRGLDRGYLSIEEESRTIRGRIDLATTVKRQLMRQGRVQVEYDELSYDVLHNRILKTTMTKLMRSDDLNREIREACYDIVHRMPEVSEIELTGLTFRHVQLGRSTSFYDLLIRICELIYESFLPSEQKGRSRFIDFDQNPTKMRMLFQAFVTNFYKRHRPDLRVTGEKTIRWEGEPCDDESAGLLPNMKVDISLESPDKHILIDTKFTAKSLQKHPHSELRRLRSEHLYQLYAYATNLAAQGNKKPIEAILLYPNVERDLSPSYMMPGRQLRVVTVDLSCEWQSIHEQLEELI